MDDEAFVSRVPSEGRWRWEFVNGREQDVIVEHVVVDNPWSDMEEDVFIPRAPTEEEGLTFCGDADADLHNGGWSCQHCIANHYVDFEAPPLQRAGRKCCSLCGMGKS